jgi:hypothetical protein
MGLLALGLRSLLVKLAIFVAMAALLAWALGGTLWPRAEVARLAGIHWGGGEWFWEIAVGGKERGALRYRLMVDRAGGRPEPFDDRWWVDVAGPALGPDGIYYAARAQDAAHWRLERIAGAAPEALHALPDRLSVEQQLARAAAGLPVQDAITIQRQRALLIEPPGDA